MFIVYLIKVNGSPYTTTYCDETEKSLRKRDKYFASLRQEHGDIDIEEVGRYELRSQANCTSQNLKKSLGILGTRKLYRKDPSTIKPKLVTNRVRKARLVSTGPKYDWKMMDGLWQVVAIL